MPGSVTSSAIIALIIAAGFAARRLGILRAGDERVLNGYVYFFAFPAFLVVKLAATEFGPETLRFLGTGAAPVGALVAVLALARALLHLERDMFYLLAIGSVFGSLAFFGLPFVEFVLGAGEPLRLGVALMAAVAPVTVGLVLVLFELHAAGGGRLRAVRSVALRLARNPLIIALVIGIALSLTGVGLPGFLRRALGLLGDTAAPLALFSLGVFLYGKRRGRLLFALGLASLRLVVLPALTLAFAALLSPDALAQRISVIMNGTPVAVNLIVLSSRYRFFEEEIASLILVSTVGSLITMNLWMLVT